MILFRHHIPLIRHLVVLVLEQTTRHIAMLALISLTEQQLGSYSACGIADDALRGYVWKARGRVVGEEAVARANGWS